MVTLSEVLAYRGVDLWDDAAAPSPPPFGPGESVALGGPDCAGAVGEVAGVGELGSMGRSSDATESMLARMVELAMAVEGLDFDSLALRDCRRLMEGLGRLQRHLDGARVAAITRMTAIQNLAKEEPSGQAAKEMSKDLGDARTIHDVVEMSGKYSRERARNDIRRAEAINELYPAFGAAMRAGSVSADHVDVLRSLLTTSQLRIAAAADEEFLLKHAQSEPVTEFRKTVKAWKFRVSPRSAEHQVRRETREEAFSIFRDSGGYRLSGWLSVLNGTMVDQAIRELVGVPSKDDRRSVPQRNAEALIGMAQAVGGLADPGSGGVKAPLRRATGRSSARFQTLVHVPLSTLIQTEKAIHSGCTHLEHSNVRDFSESRDAPGGTVRSGAGGSAEPMEPHCPVTGGGLGRQGRCLDDRADVTAELAKKLGEIRTTIRGGVFPDLLEGLSPATLTDGTPLAPSQLARILCDSGISRVVFSARGEPLDASRAQRRFSVTQEKAIIARDRTCRYPGCGRGVEFAEIHHAHEWDRGGATVTDNAVLLCFHHHQYIHSEHIVITHHAGGFVFTGKEGRIIGVRRHEAGVHVQGSQAGDQGFLRTMS